jgi:hypothetical protein
MKRTISVLLTFAVFLFLSSCSKDQYSVRFRNNFSETINNITVGSTVLGTVAPGQTSTYQPFGGHSFMISGMSVSGRALQGTESVSGKGIHKWTITLTSTGTFDFAEDL